MNLEIAATLLSIAFTAAVTLSTVSCIDSPDSSEPTITNTQMTIRNTKIADHKFLGEMYDDDHFPDFLVDKCKDVLVGLCVQIEAKKPSTDTELFELTHAATEHINDLAEEFEDNDSELETGAREALGADFAFITEAYGFDVDVEEVIAPRDW